MEWPLPFGVRRVAHRSVYVYVWSSYTEMYASCRPLSSSSHSVVVSSSVVVVTPVDQRVRHRPRRRRRRRRRRRSTRFRRHPLVDRSTRCGLGDWGGDTTNRDQGRLEPWPRRMGDRCAIDVRSMGDRWAIDGRSMGDRCAIARARSGAGLVGLWPHGG